MVTFNGLRTKALQLRKRAVAAKEDFDSKASQSRAKAIQVKAQAEIDEDRRLNEKLECLKKQERRLKSREAISRKKREIERLESRVTTKGKIITRINKELNHLIKKPKKR
jgi:hypothetical protein